MAPVVNDAVFPGAFGAGGASGAYDHWCGDRGWLEGEGATAWLLRVLEWGWGLGLIEQDSLSWVSDALILLFKESNTKGRSMSSSAFMSLIPYYYSQFYDQIPGKSNLERKSFL